MKEKVLKFLAYTFLALFMFSVAYATVPPQIMGQVPWLYNVCLAYITIAVLLFCYDIFRDLWWITQPPTPWQRHDEKNTKTAEPK